jgi:F-type H+-transporting ATPase subunit b
VLMLSTGVMLAEEEGTTSNVALVLPETAELIAGILAFAIVFFFVWRWGLPTLNKTLAARQDAIAGQISEAERAKAEAESLLADYRSQLAEAKADANSIIEDARGAAEQMKGDIVARAETDATKILAKAREEADAEKARALSDARSQVGQISVDLAGKIVGETLDAKAHRDLVERYLSDLEQM